MDISVGTYVLGIYRYRRRASLAEDRHFWSAGLGQYACAHRNDGASARWKSPPPNAQVRASAQETQIRAKQIIAGIGW